MSLLDLTAAFDTVDHELLLLPIERHFALHGIVLDWFQSYLSGRSFHVVVSDCSSTIIYIICSIPQVLVLGPLLFIVFYTAELADVVENDCIFYMRSLTIHSCIYTVIASTRRHPLTSWSSALRTLAN